VASGIESVIVVYRGAAKVLSKIISMFVVSFELEDALGNAAAARKIDDLRDAFRRNYRHVARQLRPRSAKGPRGIGHADSAARDFNRRPKNPFAVVLVKRRPL